MTKSLNDIKGGDCVVIDGAPYTVLSATHIHMQQRRANVRIKVRHLKTGQVLEKTYQSNQELEEAEVERWDAVFVYAHRDTYWFSDPSDPKNRFSLDTAVLGDAAKFLKKDLVVTALVYAGTVISVILPIKVNYVVTEAPPAIRGNTAQGGTKQVTIESGAKITVPMFIAEGDLIRVNTETGEYVERAEKGGN